MIVQNSTYADVWRFGSPDLAHGRRCMSFFQAVGSSILSLSLEVSRGKWLPFAAVSMWSTCILWLTCDLPFPAASPISYFTNLSTLNHTIPHNWTRLKASPWAAIALMLSELKAGRLLRRLGVSRVELHRPDEDIMLPHPTHCSCLYPNYGTSRLDDVLAQDVFEHLEQVEFSFTMLHVRGQPLPPLPSLSAVFAQMEESLPKLHARDITTLRKKP